MGHHFKPTLHWLDMPADLLDRRQEMIRQRSMVFRKIDCFVIFILLMLKRYKVLARYFVNLDPDDALSEDEIVELIRRRLQKFDADRLAAIKAA